MLEQTYKTAKMAKLMSNLKGKASRASIENIKPRKLNV
jgi:hypothetical protein